MANYTAGEVIPTIVLLSANHKGWFEFSICPLEDEKTLETEECFQNIRLANGNDVYNLETKEPGSFEVELQLPKDLTCKQCVFRWHWTTGKFFF